MVVRCRGLPSKEGRRRRGGLSRDAESSSAWRSVWDELPFQGTRRSGGRVVAAFGDGAMTHPHPHPTAPNRYAIRLRIPPSSRGKGWWDAERTSRSLPSRIIRALGRRVLSSPGPTGAAAQTKGCFARSEERRVGKEGDSTCRSWWEP